MNNQNNMTGKAISKISRTTFSIVGAVVVFSACGIKSFVSTDHQQMNKSFQIIKAGLSVSGDANMTWTPLSQAVGGYRVNITSDSNCSVIESSQVVKGTSASLSSTSLASVVNSNAISYLCVYGLSKSGAVIVGASNNPYLLSAGNVTASTTTKTISQSSSHTSSGLSSTSSAVNQLNSSAKLHLKFTLDS